MREAGFESSLDEWRSGEPRRLRQPNQRIDGLRVIGEEGFTVLNRFDPQA